MEEFLSEENESCVPVEYIDLIIQKGDFNQILYFYDTCREIRNYLEQPDKLGLLSLLLGSHFETFHDFMVYYINRMINILPVTEAIDFTVEFYNEISEYNLIKKIVTKEDIKLLMNKFYAVSLTKNVYRVERLAKLLYKIQGFISNENLTFTGPEMMKVVNGALGVSFLREKMTSEKMPNGDLKRIIKLLGLNYRDAHVDTILNLLKHYNYTLGGTREEFLEVLSGLSSLDDYYKFIVRYKIFDALNEAILNNEMINDKNAYIEEKKGKRVN